MGSRLDLARREAGGEQRERESESKGGGREEGRKKRGTERGKESIAKIAEL